MPKHTRRPPLSPEIIRLARLMLDKKQTDFAESVKISQSKLSKLERGQLRPNVCFENEFRGIMKDHFAELEERLSNHAKLVEWLQAE